MWPDTNKPEAVPLRKVDCGILSVDSGSQKVQHFYVIGCENCVFVGFFSRALPPVENHFASAVSARAQEIFEILNADLAFSNRKLATPMTPQHTRDCNRKAQDYVGWRLRVASLPWPPARANEATETTIAMCLRLTAATGSSPSTFQDTLTIIPYTR